MKVRSSAASLLFTVILLLIASGAQAALLFDRGLPTANLNNAAGGNRSNVAWADTTGLVGDDFTLGGTGSYYVNTITVWSTSSTGSLWFGTAGGTITNLGTTAASSAVTYSDGTSYQKTAGAFANLYQLDFTVNRVLSGSTTYQFFLDGPVTNAAYPFLHSSNAALSGSTQQGADNTLLLATIANGSVTKVEQWTSLGNGWDKTSDANIQVNGSTVPIPAAVWLLGSGLVGLISLRRRSIR